MRHFYSDHLRSDDKFSYFPCNLVTQCIGVVFTLALPCGCRANTTQRQTKTTSLWRNSRLLVAMVTGTVIVSSLRSARKSLKAFHSIPLLQQHQVDFIHSSGELLVWRLYLDSERNWSQYVSVLWGCVLYHEAHVMFSTTLCVLLVGLVGLRALDWQLVASALELEIYLINQVIDSMVWRIQGPFSPVLYFRIGFCAPLRSEAFSHLDRVFVLDC